MSAHSHRPDPDPNPYPNPNPNSDPLTLTLTPYPCQIWICHKLLEAFTERPRKATPHPSDGRKEVRLFEEKLEELVDEVGDILLRAEDEGEEGEEGVEEGGEEGGGERREVEE